MTTKQAPVNGLIDEITRYLAAVELFRFLGCEPMWLPEPGRAPRPAQASPRKDAARQTTT